MNGYWDSDSGENVIDPNTTLTRIGPWAKQRDRLPVFAVDASDNMLYPLGELETPGIYSYLAVNYHELEHLALWQNNDVIIYLPGRVKPPGLIDTDGDGLPDNVEARYNLDPDKSDTTGYYGSLTNQLDEGRQDPEALCDIVALGQVVQKQDAWQVDWASFGVQFGTRGTYFPFMYTPFNPNEPFSTSLPSDAVTSLP